MPDYCSKLYESCFLLVSFDSLEFALLMWFCDIKRSVAFCKDLEVNS